MSRRRLWSLALLSALALLPACKDQSPSPGGTRNPTSCLPVGGTCASPQDCCSGACPDGTCRDATQCKALAQACTLPSDCCSVSCGNGVCTESAATCSALTASCT